MSVPNHYLSNVCGHLELLGGTCGFDLSHNISRRILLAELDPQSSCWVSHKWKCPVLSLHVSQ